MKNARETDVLPGGVGFQDENHDQTAGHVVRDRSPVPDGQTRVGDDRTVDVARTRGPQTVRTAQGGRDRAAEVVPAARAVPAAAQAQRVPDGRAADRVRPEKRAAHVGRAVVQEDAASRPDDQQVRKNKPRDACVGASDGVPACSRRACLIDDGSSVYRVRSQTVCEAEYE